MIGTTEAEQVPRTCDDVPHEPRLEERQARLEERQLFASFPDDLDPARGDQLAGEIAGRPAVDVAEDQDTFAVVQRRDQFPRLLTRIGPETATGIMYFGTSSSIGRRCRRYGGLARTAIP
jgi:hypothetical protein